jgi:hypothetical protein
MVRLSDASLKRAASSCDDKSTRKVLSRQVQSTTRPTTRMTAGSIMLSPISVEDEPLASADPSILLENLGYLTVGTAPIAEEAMKLASRQTARSVRKGSRVARDTKGNQTEERLGESF